MNVLRRPIEIATQSGRSQLFVFNIDRICVPKCEGQEYVMFRVGFVVLICTIGCTHASAQEAERVFIQHTPLTEQELDDYKKELINDSGWSVSTAEKFVTGADQEHYRFGDVDFRVALPCILPTDNLASICSNSMMHPETRLVYLSPALDNRVTVKASECSLVEGGLSCSPLSEYEQYYFESPEHNFTLDNDVTFDEASNLLAIFRDNGIPGLPDWHQRARFGYLGVTSVGRIDDVYVLRLGDIYCGHCTATFKVRIEHLDSEHPRLVLVEGPEGICI